VWIGGDRDLNASVNLPKAQDETLRFRVDRPADVAKGPSARGPILKGYQIFHN